MKSKEETRKRSAWIRISKFTQPNCITYNQPSYYYGKIVTLFYIKMYIHLDMYMCKYIVYTHVGKIFTSWHKL